MVGCNHGDEGSIQVGSPPRPEKRQAFRGVDDTLGHKVGDRAFSDTAMLLRRVFRASDVIARLGGDEFVVLAGDCRAGTSRFDPARPVALETLLADADARMYEAKQNRTMSMFPRIHLS